MELKGLSELDLNGELFIHYPDDMTLSECRDSMELDIADQYDLDFAEGYAEDEKPEMAITPYWVWRAVVAMYDRNWRRMSEEDQERELKRAWSEREDLRKRRVDG